MDGDVGWWTTSGNIGFWDGDNVSQLPYVWYYVGFKHAREEFDSRRVVSVLNVGAVTVMCVLLFVVHAEIM